MNDEHPKSRKRYCGKRRLSKNECAKPKANDGELKQISGTHDQRKLNEFFHDFIVKGCLRARSHRLRLNRTRRMFFEKDELLKFLELSFHDSRLPFCQSMNRGIATVTQKTKFKPKVNVSISFFFRYFLMEICENSILKNTNAIFSKYNW